MIAAEVEGQKMSKVVGCHPCLLGSTQNRSRYVSSHFALPEEDREPEVDAGFRKYVEKYYGKVSEEAIEGIKGILADQNALSLDHEIADESQGALEKLHQNNRETLKELMHTGQEVLDNCAHRCNLEKSDKELFESYKTVTQRLKEKALNEEEKDTIKKFLKSRQMILIRLGKMEG